MITQATQDLIKQRGWRFVASHDVRGQAVPEYWVNDEKNYPAQYDINDVLEIINNEIELEIEAGLR